MRIPRVHAVPLTLALAVVLAGVAAPSPGSPPQRQQPVRSAVGGEQAPPKTATESGFGGAVSSVDPYASRIGLRVLEDGGNATDAAVATAAALGVTEPYSSGIGGGGYFVHYDADSGRIRTLDGRETAPQDMPRDAFIDPESETGEPYNFFPELVTSGVSVGVPGTPKTWRKALRRFGTMSLRDTLQPAARLARRGFMVGETFRQQTEDNAERFRAFPSTRRLFLPGGEAPSVGSRLTNPDLAATYNLLRREGLQPFYDGELAKEIVRAVRKPPTVRNPELPVPPGFMRRSDLADYSAINQRPTRMSYRGYDVYGMRPSSSGGSTVGESLNILEQFDLTAMDDVSVLHHYFEASALAFADRAAYLGDTAFVDVPLRDLLSDEFAAERACEIDSTQAMPKPTEPGDVTDYDGACDEPTGAAAPADDTENVETTNLTAADRWGNVVEYTLTIEQTGGSGIVVPGRGFLLNNELTDFSLEYVADDPNRIQPGKRPRSSMSPTMVLHEGEPFLALGSPGGSTIITTVLQTLVNRIDRGMPIPDALAAPRATERNFPTVTAEPEFLALYQTALEAYGHEFTEIAEIGAATAIEFGPEGLMTAVAEPERRGGGDARVVDPVAPD